MTLSDRIPILHAHFKIPGIEAALENDGLCSENGINGTRLLKGWVCSPQEIREVSLVINAQNIFTGILLPPRDDIRIYGKDRYAYGFEISYMNITSLFRDDDKADLRLCFTLSNGEIVSSDKLLPDHASFLHSDVTVPKTFTHDRWLEELVGLCDKPGARVLELGARKVNTVSPKEMFKHAEHVGFDIYPGKNVDVVGDAHCLEKYFKAESFDLIFSSAVFEHLVMPWVVAKHILHLLKVGGYVFVETHFSYSSHERPWHFFHFTDLGLKALFPEVLGIECIDAGMSNPIVAKFSKHASPYLENHALTGMYCHAEFLGKKVRCVQDMGWEHYTSAQITAGTAYPMPADVKSDSLS